MGTLLAIVVVGGAVVAIFLTTDSGRQLRERIGWPRSSGARAPREDHEFLLRACGGDYDELQRRLEAELERNPALSEAESYRKAIRRYFSERGDPTSTD